ncbi:hypothetical protein GWL_45040 [Herbaspirillum sp. GW103]|nr:hypothetical protein GWL_45040 [Herbaspirillum sp. GW103]
MHPYGYGIQTLPSVGCPHAWEGVGGPVHLSSRQASQGGQQAPKSRRWGRIPQAVRSRLAPQ